MHHYSCDKCNKQHAEIEKLKNKVRDLAHIARKIANGAHVSQNEAKRVLANATGEKITYYEAE